MRTGCLDHGLEASRVLQHRTGAKEVVIEGLAFVVLHEQRGFQALQKAHVVNVGVGVVNEHARFYVACGVDMQVTAASCDAASYELTVVLEVHEEKRLLLAHPAHETVHPLALLHGEHELGRGVHAHRHVVEDPAEQGTLLDHPVHKFFGPDGVGVLGRDAGRDAEGKSVGLQQRHGGDHLVVGALAATGVGGLPGSLGADGGHEILNAQQILTEVLVDEGGVGEAQETAVRMRLAEPDQILLAHQRLASGVDVDVAAKLFALANDGVDVVVGEVEFVAVLGRPATGAAQVAGAGRVQQDSPGNVAPVLLAHLLLDGPGH